MTEGSPLTRSVSNWMDNKFRDRYLHPDDTLDKSFGRFFGKLAWIAIGWVVAGGLAALGLYLFGRWHPDAWGPVWGAFFLGGLALAALILWIRALVYVHHDARRRHMAPALWVVICVFVPYLLGFLTYFLLRRPRPIACPHCQGEVPLHSKFCSHCGRQLHAVCVKCGASLEPDVRFCRECGAGVESGAPSEESV
jgi:hypothetical protein